MSNTPIFVSFLFIYLCFYFIYGNGLKIDYLSYFQNFNLSTIKYTIQNIKGDDVIRKEFVFWRRVVGSYGEEVGASGGQTVDWLIDFSAFYFTININILV